MFLSCTTLFDLLIHHEDCCWEFYCHLRNRLLWCICCGNWSEPASLSSKVGVSVIMCSIMHNVRLISTKLQGTSVSFVVKSKFKHQTSLDRYAELGSCQEGWWWWWWWWGLPPCPEIYCSSAIVYLEAKTRKSIILRRMPCQGVTCFYPPPPRTDF